MNKEERKIYNKNYYKNNLEKHSECVKTYYNKNKNAINKKQRAWTKTPNGIYKRYRTTARRKGYDFKIEKEVFLKITSKNCFYCDTNEKIGMDRVNNNKGYTKDNVVPCCTTCNFMKKDMEVSKFINQAIKIYGNMLDKSIK